jgi:hypothetical protein
MNVWIRIYSVVETDDGSGGGSLTLEVTSKLHIVIHRTEKSARGAATKFGGFVLEVAASSLKNVREFPDILLAETDSNIGGTAEEGEADKTAYMTVACDDVPYKTVFQSLTTAEFSDTPPKNDEYQDLMKFTDAGFAYLDILSAELGDVDLHQ